MIQVEFNIQVVDESQHETPLLDETEVRLLLESTQAHLNRHIQKRLADFVCDEHGETPRVVVNGTYSLDTEQMEISYNVDACCNTMVMRTAALLSR